MTSQAMHEPGVLTGAPPNIVLTAVTACTLRLQVPSCSRETESILGKGFTLSCSKRVSKYSCMDSGLLRSGLSRWSRYLQQDQNQLLPVKLFASTATQNFASIAKQKMTGIASVCDIAIQA